MFRPSDFIIAGQPLSSFLSMSHHENEITSFFSSTYWEHFFCPFVFDKSLGGTFILNIFISDTLCFQRLIGRYFSLSLSLRPSAPLRTLARMLVSRHDWHTPESSILCVSPGFWLGVIINDMGTSLHALTANGP